MPTYLHPGVYIEELPSGSKPIEGVATSVTAFVGPTARGPVDVATLIQSLDDYKALYGDIASETDTMGLAMLQFYQNGGKDAYICRVAGDAPPAAAASFGVAGQNTGGAAVLTIAASSVGSWGEELFVQIVKPNATDSAFSLRAGRIAGGVLRVDERFDGLTMNERDPNYALTRVNRDSLLIRLTALPAIAANVQNGSLAGAAVGAGATFFSAGMVDGMALRLNVDGLGVRSINLGPVAGLGLLGAANQADGDAVAAAIQAAVRLLDPTEAAYTAFTCVYAGTRFTLTSGTSATFSSVDVPAGSGGATDLAAFLSLNPAAAPTRVLGSAAVVPVQVLGPGGNGRQLLGGADAAPAAGNYTDFFNQVLAKVRDVSIVVLPGASWPADQAIVDAARAHCEATQSRMLIVDLDEGLELDQGATVDGLGLPTSTYTCTYYPWVATTNPFYNVDTNPNASLTLNVAPSAYAAGMWARIDARRGVWKAPAGVETQLTGAVRLQFQVEEGEQDFLNPRGINAIRRLPGFGSVFWGSRTLATNAAPEWRYVPIRRTAIFIERSIYNGIQWAVFEPNDHPLWSSLRANIGAFMNGMFRAGAFQGAKADDAYFVRCGLGQTMTQADIDRGQVIVVVGFAPLKPAEFVIVRIQQIVNQQ